MVDTSVVKQKLAALQSKGKKGNKEFEKIDYKTVYWKAPVGDTIVRMLPLKIDKEFPFQEVKFHYGVGAKTMLSLGNWNEKDPIEEAADKLVKSNDETHRKLGYKLRNKSRWFCQVVVRGEEAKGVRLWEVGKEVYESLLKHIDDPDYGDITDVMKGHDIVVNVEVADPYNKTTIRLKPKPSVALTDADLLKKCLEEQKNPLDLRKKFTYDEKKSALLEWLEPKNEEEKSEEEENDETDEVEDKIEDSEEINDEDEDENLAQSAFGKESPILKKDTKDAELDALFDKKSGNIAVKQSEDTTIKPKGRPKATASKKVSSADFDNLFK
jgi:hypothetical protein